MSTAPPGRDSLGIFLPGPVPEAHQAGTGGHMLPACCHGWKLRPAQPGPFGKSWAAGQKLQRDERKKKAPACASAGAPHSAAAHSSSQPASPRPFPRQARLLFPPPPSPHRFDSISCSRVWLVSQALRHHYLRALLLPPPPPSCSPSCFIFIFHLPSAVSPPRAAAASPPSSRYVREQTPIFHSLPTAKVR